MGLECEHTYSGWHFDSACKRCDVTLQRFLNNARLSKKMMHTVIVPDGCERNFLSMAANSIFNLYHAVMKHFDKIGVPYIMQQDGTSDIPQWVFRELPVSVAVKPDYSQDVIWITMRPGLEISADALPEMIRFTNFHNEFLPSGNIFISTTTNELMLRESIHTYADIIDEIFIASVLIRMHHVITECLERCIPIVDEGKTCVEALALWEKANNESKNADENLLQSGGEE